MILFFTRQVHGNTAFFSPEESRHMGQALRKSVGEEVSFVDGNGGKYRGRVSILDRNGAEVDILEKTECPVRPFRLHLAIAPTKQMARLEWLLEKITEIGVEEISLLACDRSERPKVKLERLNRIIGSAMKQSLQAWLPRLNDLAPLDAFLEKEHPGLKYIGWCEDEPKAHLKHNLQPGEDVTILIGPEGDFTKREVDLAQARGFEPVSLGPHRLRTETAGLVACHAVNLINE